jgi:phosphatidylglycerophosphatase A
MFAGMGWLGAPMWLHVVVQLMLCAMACAGCLHHGGKVEAVVGRKDPGVVVVDEVAGMALTLVLALAGVVIVGAPNAGAVTRALPMSLALTAATASFFWFRVMDVIKPPPARGLQRVPGGAGVLIDDLVVAPYAAIAVVVSLELMVRLQPMGG